MTEKKLVTQASGGRYSDVEAEERMLLAELRSGSNVGFDRVYEAYRARIYAFLLRMAGTAALAEDLLQEVFIKLARKATSLAEDTNLKAWLFAVARNSVISHMRWRAAQSRSLEALGAGQGERVATTPLHAAELAETQARLETALASLDPKYREVVLLVAVEGLSPGEAAQVIGIKGDALRQRLARARLQLSRALESETEAKRPRSRRAK